MASGSTKSEIISLVEGKRYLVKENSYCGNLHEVKIIEISHLAYCVIFNEGQKHWVLKEDFTEEYKIIEELKPNNPSIEEIKQKLRDFDFNKSIPPKIIEFKSNELKTIPCISCNGFGVVSDENSPSGQKICPNCFGSKYLLK
jgi:hypothetical protein